MIAPDASVAKALAELQLGKFVLKELAKIPPLNVEVPVPCTTIVSVTPKYVDVAFPKVVNPSTCSVDDEFREPVTLSGPTKVDDELTIRPLYPIMLPSA